MQARDVIARIDAALQQPLAGGLVVGLVRLDHLPHLNELIGYDGASLVLDQFQQRVRTLARKQDTSIAMDKQTVVLVLRGLANSEHVALAAAKLQRLFEVPIEVHDESVKVDVQAGFVMLPSRAHSAREVLRRAEGALRRAQRERCSWALGDAQETPGAGIDLALRRRIEDGINQGQFVLYHQPKAHLGYRTIVGAEALMRWHLPGKGVIAPTEFIPAAERSELIRPLTWFALNAAMAEARLWPDELSTAVNLAPVLLDDPDLVQVIRDGLAIFDLAPRRLTIEITESGVAGNRDRAFAVLSELRELGVRVAIDDFGTGYSSFANFRDIPADELKIDCSFVSRMLTSDADARIVKSIIDLAHNFSMKAVAEGVEDAETGERLKALGCDYMQGYWLSKPLPAKQFREWLSRKLGPGSVTVH